MRTAVGVHVRDAKDQPSEPIAGFTSLKYLSPETTIIAHYLMVELSRYGATACNIPRHARGKHF
ncbi:hypothetical protein RMR16_005655 [Agrobacterium sp. rho-13.3]|uniref:hypothetical protein n=1 Tax=Agrobacterium sp. rho-13.3 TaxID=3072980 RepID=UPI002A0BB6C7|nr:hypothetical protein [Agrobacterium sp. rho-13.3]MDX8309487.1 hypothetical protein [Agrobacterium sp. rho-13.3]